MCFAVMWDNGVVRPHPPLVRAMEIAKRALEAAGHEGAYLQLLGAWLASSLRGCERQRGRPRADDAYVPCQCLALRVLHTRSDRLGEPPAPGDLHRRGERTLARSLARPCSHLLCVEQERIFAADDSLDLLKDCELSGEPLMQTMSPATDAHDYALDEPMQVTIVGERRHLSAYEVS